jgi:hypothetical protein
VTTVTPEAKRRAACLYWAVSTAATSGGH